MFHDWFTPLDGEKEEQDLQLKKKKSHTPYWTGAAHLQMCEAHPVNRQS